MNMETTFKQGKPLEKVVILLEHLQFADPGSPDIDEDNSGQSWGHDQFTAGGITPTSSLTTWQDVGDVTTAFRLVAAALKICQEVRLMCSNAGAPKTDGFISNIYLKQILDNIEECWTKAGGVRLRVFLQNQTHTISTRHFLLPICLSSPQLPHVCLSSLPPPHACLSSLPLLRVHQLFLPPPLVCLLFPPVPPLIPTLQSQRCPLKRMGSR